MDEGIILDFEVDGRHYTVGRPPIRKQSTLAAGEPSMVWRVRNDRGHVIVKWPCSDTGLGAVIDERCRMIERRGLPDEKPDQVIAGRMLHIAVLQQAKLTALAAGVLDPPPYGVQLSRRAGWRKPPNTVVVTRPHSPYANPFTVDSVQALLGLTREEAHRTAVRWHEVWLDTGEQPLPDDAFTDTALVAQREYVLDHIVEDLRGKNLGCWCGLDAPCHRNTLLKRANA